MNHTTLWEKIKQQHPYLEIQVRNISDTKVYQILSTTNRPIKEATLDQLLRVYHNGYSLRFTPLAPQSHLVAENLPYKSHTHQLYVTHSTEPQFQQNTTLTPADIEYLQHQYCDIILINQTKLKPQLSVN
ncbi:hypothetical protein A2642_03460 [Candidatus Nomurabacteria bacterium RIFCSPHIGHO2_01_FULL_39_10]|uniref:Uncharacterized protein n=1 Tax=Candidatus Nomurabacteria bacterium RIFCSPHIGHO2_01_FULL_39_10 TaxID=1801733 RepID=A0A1F6V9K5_9BACT|nr:MAG: hypothetical protein A2642_03460 [Candidatus Nomurabacteria bacterium RIFCSPHIGHO2_01_FULL_39_10]